MYIDCPYFAFALPCMYVKILLLLSGYLGIILLRSSIDMLSNHWYNVIYYLPFATNNDCKFKSKFSGDTVVLHMYTKMIRNYTSKPIITYPIPYIIYTLNFRNLSGVMCHMSIVRFP
mgnify:FL=1